MMNISNASESCLPESQHISITVFLCLVIFIGFLLNIFSLWVFCCRFTQWTSGTTLQFHLALNDILITPAAPLVVAYLVMGPDWPFGRFLCQVKIAILSTHFYGSTIFLTLISIHRYTMVVQFNRRSRIKDKVFVQKLCAGVWCLFLIQALVYALMLPSSIEGKNNQCLSIYQKDLTDSYFIINFIRFILGFLLPFCVSAACYGRLASTLTRLNIRTSKGQKVQEKSQRMVGVCLFIFGLCFLPMNVVRTVGVIVKKYYPLHCQALRMTETAYYTSWIFAEINCCLDPLIYLFGSQKFREAFQSLSIRRREAPNISESEEAQRVTCRGSRDISEQL